MGDPWGGLWDVRAVAFSFLAVPGDGGGSASLVDIVGATHVAVED